MIISKKNYIFDLSYHIFDNICILYRVFLKRTIMKVTALLLLATASISSAVRLEIKPFKRLIPADVLRGNIASKLFNLKSSKSFILSSGSSNLLMVQQNLSVTITLNCKFCCLDIIRSRLQCSTNHEDTYILIFLSKLQKKLVDKGK